MWIFRACRLCILHANCLVDVACMAERKREPFINRYNYQEGAALQNRCPCNTSTQVAFHRYVSNAVSPLMHTRMADLSINHQHRKQQELRDCNVIDIGL